MNLARIKPLLLCFLRILIWSQYNISNYKNLLSVMSSTFSSGHIQDCAFVRCHPNRHDSEGLASASFSCFPGRFLRAQGFGIPNFLLFSSSRQKQVANAKLPSQSNTIIFPPDELQIRMATLSIGQGSCGGSGLHVL